MKILVLAALTIAPVLLFAQEKYVSVNQETQVLSQGAKSVFRSEIFYNKELDAVVTHHTYPSEFIKLANRFGELKIYFPQTNTVSLTQDESYSTTNELLYYFINNRQNDLGLRKENFTLVKTKMEEDLVVTTWQAPAGMQAVDQIMIVFRDSDPIYAEYTDVKGTVLKKIYYSAYENFQTFSLPLRITEIEFLSKADSIIRLSVFSNPRVSNVPDNSYFNFKVPNNARITQ